MKRSMIVFFLISIGMLTLSTDKIEATMVLEKDFEAMAKESDLVFAGTVSDIRSEWDGEPYHSEINTYVIFTDLEIIAGDYGGKSIEVRLSGGKVNSAEITYTGMPQFHLGERNLLFLTGNFIELCPIVGWNQGLFKVIQDQETGEELLYSSDGRLITEIEDNKFIVNNLTTRITGGAGIPDDAYTPKNQTRSLPQTTMKVGADKKLRLNHLTKATREKREQFKKEGATLGYAPPANRGETSAPKSGQGIQ